MPHHTAGADDIYVGNHNADAKSLGVSDLIPVLGCLSVSLHAEV